MATNRRGFMVTLVISSMIIILACIRQPERGNQQQILHPPEELLGQDEGCVQCHGEVTGFAPGHQPEAIGCASCHLGNPKVTDKDAAHMSMVPIPGNLSNARATCGNKACHPEIIDRVSNSLMATMAGVVSTNRHVFNPAAPAASNPHIEELAEDTPADTHLRQLCASCHLGREKREFGAVDATSRGGGCTACHLNYTEDAKQDLVAYIRGNRQDSLLYTHPGLTLEVTDTHCFGCHSRSGRISTSYEGWMETTLEAKPAQNQERFRALPDGRVFEQYAADIHHERGLDCIDCHIGTELMGDGNRYRHKAEALKVQCSDCHASGTKNTIYQDDLTDEEKKILNIRGIDQSLAFLATEKTGEGLLNTFVRPDGVAFMVGKNTRDTFQLAPPATICLKDAAHARLSCESCHTGWAPQCLGCHTSYDPLVNGFDLLARKKTKGKWSESIGVFLAEPPPLGVVTEKMPDGKQVEHIKTFIAGMVMTLDKSGFPGHKGDSTEFRRLFAPVSAHTTSAGGRTCASCHLDPLAIGYGRGQLTFQTNAQTGRWVFEPEYVNHDVDGLPEDAWIPFLGERKTMSTTRSVSRPFNIEEQEKILTVGACLTCHEEDSEVMMRSLEGFEKVWKERAPACILPAFD